MPKEKRKKPAQESSNLRCEDIAQDAAELLPNTKTFTIGDGKYYGKYENKELEKGQRYEVFQCGTTGEIVSICIM